MSRLNDALLVIVPLGYLFALFLYWLDTGETRRPPKRWPIAVVFSVLLLHGCLIWARGRILGQVPWTTYSDMMSVLGFLMTFTYLAVELFTRVRATGFDLLPVPLTLVTYAAAFGPHVPKPNPTLDSPHFLMHTIPAVGGIAAVLVSGIYGLLYLRLDRTMRKKSFGRFFQRMPSLQIIARMNSTASIIGLVLVTAAIGWGAAWYGDLFERVDVFEPKIGMTLLIWLVLLLPVIGKVLRRWPDRATALVSVVTMSLAMLSIIVTLLPFVSFHGHR